MPSPSSAPSLQTPADATGLGEVAGARKPPRPSPRYETTPFAVLATTSILPSTLRSPASSPLGKPGTTDSAGCAAPTPPAPSPRTRMGPPDPAASKTSATRSTLPSPLRSAARIHRGDLGAPNAKPAVEENAPGALARSTAPS